MWERGFLPLRRVDGSLYIQNRLSAALSADAPRTQS